MKHLSSIAATIAILAMTPIAVDAARFDLRLLPTVTVLPALPLVSTPVKLYVTVDNVGADDVEGMVMFRDGDVIIGQKPISVKAVGSPEEVWLNWTPKTIGSHTISIRVVNDVEYPEATVGDNETSKNIFVDQDTDGDGVPDSIDPDIDNDGLTNEQEATIGTNPLKVDTDGDGVTDKDDYYPLDPKRSKKEVPPPPKPVVKPVVVVTAPKTVTSSVVPLAKPAPSVSPVVANASATSAVQIVLSDTVARNEAEYVIATSTATTTQPTPVNVSITSSTPREDDRAAEPSVIEQKKGGADMTSIALWSAAGLLGLLTAVAFFIAKRKEEE